MSQRIGYRQELANRYLEYMRQAEVADQPKAQPSATPDQETVHEASRDGLAYRSASDALKPSLKNQLDAAFMQGRAQREQDLGAAEIERREKSGQRHSSDGGGVGLRRPLRITDPQQNRTRETAAERIAKREENYEEAVDHNEAMVARVQAGEAPKDSKVDVVQTEVTASSDEPSIDTMGEQVSESLGGEDISDIAENAKPAAEVTRTDVVFDAADSAYRRTYVDGAQTASGEGKSIVDRDRTETVVGESLRASPAEKTRITRSDDV